MQTLEFNRMGLTPMDQTEMQQIDGGGPGGQVAARVACAAGGLF